MSCRLNNHKWLFESLKWSFVVLAGVMFLNALFPVIEISDFDRAKHEQAQQLAAERDCKNVYGVNKNGIVEIVEPVTKCKTKRNYLIGEIK